VGCSWQEIDPGADVDDPFESSDPALHMYDKTRPPLFLHIAPNVYLLQGIDSGKNQCPPAQYYLIVLLSFRFPLKPVNVDSLPSAPSLCSP
jgi:hypothetical protein